MSEGTLMVVIETDQDYDPRTAVDWPADETAAYVKQFERGELTPYIVTLVREVECGDDGTSRGCGATHDHYLASLAGCDVETGNADGRYPSIAFIPDEYLRTVATELCAEVGIDPLTVA